MNVNYSFSWCSLLHWGIQWQGGDSGFYLFLCYTETFTKIWFDLAKSSLLLLFFRAFYLLIVDGMNSTENLHNNNSNKTQKTLVK